MAVVIQDFMMYIIIFAFGLWLGYRFRDQGGIPKIKLVKEETAKKEETK